MPEILITHDDTIDIATGRSRQEVSWKNRNWLWSDFIKRVSVTHRTAETYGEYCTAKKQRQDELKDVGGFVGGYLSSGRRTRTSVIHRQLVTLDIDHGAPGMWEEFVMAYGNAGCCYSTHKHSPEAPRLRLILPLDREVGPDEYQAIARRIAGNLGIENFDHTTFEPSRLMYWPSTSADGIYQFDYQDGGWISADDVLASYHNWRDSSEWPVSDRFQGIVHRNIKKQGDPTEKAGVIGAFCRTYTVEQAIETFLPDVYTACDVPERYTYREGSTSGGLIVYDDKYTYSHHGTDPTSMKLCNAFDLVRLHKYGLRDEDSRVDTPSNKLPSFVAMSEFAHKDTKVRKQYGAERFAEAFAAFTELPPDLGEAEGSLEEEPAPELPLEMEWVIKLDVDKKGNYYCTVDNIVIILENDPRLKDHIWLNVFAQREGVRGHLPWRKSTGVDDALSDRDLANLRHYFEKFYSITSGPKLEDALKVLLEKNQYHPVRDYLDKVVWDGAPRIDALLTTYLGAEPSPYTEAITRKTLVAAVARVFKPGCKFDYMLILIGEQGTLKSTLISKLGRSWFSDRFNLGMIHSKEAAEQIQGIWVMEVGELAGMRKADIESVKSFISAPTDRYRVPFATRAQNFPRQCVFIGTSNIYSFLRDKTGNRRFWAAMLGVVKPLRSVHSLTDAEVSQIWAEAAHYYKQGEPLYLSAELEAVAATVQEGHVEQDDRAGMIAAYLETKVPVTWEEMNVYERRGWLAGGETGEGVRWMQYVCAATIWVELFNGKQDAMTTQNTKFIHEFMQNANGWAKAKSNRNFNNYGSQRSYYRLESRPDTAVTVKKGVGSAFKDCEN
jgi:putative DNA primase/helicase